MTTFKIFKSIIQLIQTLKTQKKLKFCATLILRKNQGKQIQNKKAGYQDGYKYIFQAAE